MELRGETGVRLLPIVRARPFEIWIDFALAGSCSIGHFIKCLALNVQRDCSSVAGARLRAATAVNGCSGKSGGIAVQKTSWSS